MKKIYRRALKSLERFNPDRLRTLVQELTEYTAQLEMVLSSLPGGVVVIDSDNRVLLFNNPAMRLIPLTVRNPAGKLIWQVINSKDISSYVKEAVEENRGAVMRDFPLSSRSRILSCGILTLTEQGYIKGSMLYVEDVTQKRAEQERMRRMEGLASLTTMSAGVAHEIKNPLASMSIHVQLLKRKLNRNYVNPEEFCSTLDILEEEITRLNTIVSNYLFTVQPTSPGPMPEDINTMLAELVQFLHYELDNANIHVLQNFDKTIPLLNMDEGAMKQVFLNLVKNAMAAMPNGGELEIDTQNCNDGICVTISDTGDGIPENIQGKIFEPYFTTRDNGSGLGLSVVYKIVKEHGGDIQVDSAIGRGTKFSISLPVPYKQRLLPGGNL